MTTHNARDPHDYLNGLLLTDRAALDFLYKNTLGNRDVPPEQAVVDLLKHLREHQGHAPHNLKHWLGAMGSLDRRYQEAVLRLCGFYRDEATAEKLQAILRQLTWVSVHPAAVSALAQTLGIHASRALADMLWDTPIHQWHLRETAILRELGRLGWTSSIDHLLRALSVPYENPARAAAQALACFEPQDVTPRLLALLTAASDPRQAAGAAEALGLLGDASAIAALQKASRAPDPRLATAAAVALARLGDDNAEAFLVRMATEDRGHAHAELRARSLHALGLLGQRRAAQPGGPTAAAITQGLDDSQPEVRAAAAQALGMLALSPLSRALAQALRKEVSPLVRSSMIQALGRLGNAMSVPILLELLRRDSRSVQIEILNALALFSDPRLADHIAPFRASPDPELRDAAERALRRLLHRPFAWPRPAPLEAPLTIPLYTHHDARQLLLPPPPASPPPSFFERLFGASPRTPPRHAPTPIGELHLDPQGLRLSTNDPADPRGPQQAQLAWERRFTLHITREPIGPAPTEDTGVHFTLRQRSADDAVHFHTVAVSLWCAPGAALARLDAKGERLPCLDPHLADPLLAALRYYTDAHGDPIHITQDE
jgi:HEAT repeat protein